MSEILALAKFSVVAPRKSTDVIKPGGLPQAIESAATRFVSGIATGTGTTTFTGKMATLPRPASLVAFKVMEANPSLAGAGVKMRIQSRLFVLATARVSSGTNV